jgi:nucleoside-diphosphate-sugar epimerase
MKVLVTGATGFVGGHLCDDLISRGHEVFALVRNLEKAKEFNIPGTYIQGSLSHDKEHNWVEELPSDLDAVIHTAGIVHSFNLDDFQKVNFEATQQLFNDLKTRYPKLKMVFISTLAAMKPAQKGIELTESDLTNPPSAYGLSKEKAEKFLIKEAPKNWEIIIIRPPMVIGPRDTGVLDVFKMVESGLILLTGLNGKNKEYSFVCVHDLVDVIIKSLESPGLHGEVFFAAHPENISLIQLIETIQRKMNKKAIKLPIPMPVIKSLAHTLSGINKIIPISIRLTPDKVHELTPESWLCSGKKSEEKLKKEYCWNLERTIETTLQDYRKRGWLK